MNKSLGLLLAASLLTLSACGGGYEEEVDNESEQSDNYLVGNRQYGAVAGDSARHGQNQSMAPDDVTSQATVCPGSTVVRGIDVSYYQGSINWTSVRNAGKRFAIIRVSDGTGFLDPNFATNWRNAKAAGLTVGAYQFFRPTQDPIAQADLMVNKLQSVGFYSTDIPPVIDVEVTGGLSGSTIISRVNTWLQRVRSRTGRLPVLYTSPGFWSSIGNPTPSPLPYLWVAHWGATCPNLPPNWGRLRFWQYSATGSVSGISGNVDLDLYNGSLTELRSL